MRTPPDEIRSIRDRCVNSTNVQLRLHYYTLGNYLAAEEIERSLEVGEIVVLDRFHASTMAYLWAFKLLPYDGRIDWPEGLLKPDYMFLINLP
jgi:thymidylate kinase